MSNPVSNTEIEDVLSSIRRLVNEEARNIVAASQPQREEKPAKLVLTQSLRVEDEPRGTDADWNSVPDDGEAEEPTPGADDSHAAEFTSQRTAPVENMEPASDGEPEAYSNEPEDPGLAADPIQDSHKDLNENHSDDFVFIREAKLKLRAEQRADLQDQPPETGTQDDDAEESADTGSDADSAPWKDPDATLYAAAAVEDGETEDDHQQAAEGTSASPELAAIESAPLGSKIEAFEAAIGQTDDQWEPDGDVGDDYAGTQVETIQWEDHEEEDDDTSEWQASELPPELEAEAEVAPEPAEDPEHDHAPDFTHDHSQDHGLTEDETDEDALDVLSSDESVLDEESLRELVADIVRQELQGALGERITRNVRKLVRREIHRALVAQDLE